MDADQKRYFCALCTSGNITRAAKGLYLSRQGLSKSMKALESQLGTALFVRNKAGIELTESGRILRRYIQEEDRLWNSCMLDIKTANDNSPDLIQIGLQSMFFGYDQKRSLFAIFRGDTSIQIDVIDGDHDAYWQALAEGNMDVACTLQPPDSACLPSVRLDEDALSVLVGVESALAKLLQVDFEIDLPGRVVLQTSPYKNKLYDSLFRSRGIGSELLDFDKNLMLARVATGEECFIVQSRLAKTFSTEQVCAKPLVNAPFTMGLYLVWRPDIGRAAKRVARALLESFGKGDDGFELFNE